jgi:amino acid transporter
MCVLLFAAFMFLSFMSLSEAAITVFWWLVSLTAAGVLVSWSSILLNHIRLMQALKTQGIDANRLPWHNWWTSKYSVLYPVGLLANLLQNIPRRPDYSCASSFF